MTRCSDKEVKVAIEKMMSKYAFFRKGVEYRAKVKMGLKLHDYLYDFILVKEGCHWGFCTGNHIVPSELDGYIKNIEERMLTYAAPKGVKIVPIEKTWKLGPTLYV